MSRRRNGEPNYLARAKPKRDPIAFSEIVREAFDIEYGLLKDAQIADLLDVTPGWISTMLNHPEQVESAALGSLLSAIKSKRSKRKILRAWVERRFAIDLFERHSPDYARHTPDERTIRRVYRMIVEGEPFIAANFALAAAKESEDRNLRGRLLDLALLARQRSNLLGQAMQVAKLIASSGRADKDPVREAIGYRARAQVMLQLPNSTPAEVFPLLAVARERYERALHSPLANPAVLRTLKESLERQEVAARIVFMERGVVEKDKSDLRGMVFTLTPYTKLKSKSARFVYYHLLSRVYLLLGERFLAEEYLEHALNASKGQVLHGRELCGIVQSRIVAETRSVDEVCDFLWELSNNCRRRWDLQHVQVLEMELARQESKTFESEPPFSFPTHG